jgi:HTH-type transcriptional regulator / antitoxin HipB
MENIVNDFRIQTSGQLKAVLRSLRRAQHLSQSELGRKVGLSQERISAIENHPERIPTDQLLTLLMALGAELCIRSRALDNKSAAIW